MGRCVGGSLINYQKRNHFLKRVLHIYIHIYSVCVCVCMYRNQETVKSSGNYPDGIEEVELVQEVFSFAHVRQAGSLANL